MIRVIYLRVEDDLHDKIVALARRENRSVNSMCVVMLKTLMLELEGGEKEKDRLPAKKES